MLNMLLLRKRTQCVYGASGVYVENLAVSAQYPDPEYVIGSPAFRSNFVNFTSQEDMLQFINELKNSSSNLQTELLGISQDGRDIPLLKFQKPSDIDSEVLKENGKPTVLIIGQQHGNEVAGGEAALAIASELAGNPSVLDKINVLIVPRANPDGTYRNVRGLTNGDNVNRDHLLLQSPEGQALARVFREYKPEIVIDCHEFPVAAQWLAKFNGLQKVDAMLQYATVPNLASYLRPTAALFRYSILAAFDSNNLTHTWYHITTGNDSDRVVSMGGIDPDIGRNIAGLRNTISFLLETRGTGLGEAHFKRRVFTHLVAIRAIFDFAAKNHQMILKVQRDSDAEVIASAGKGTITIVGSQTPENKSIQLLNPNDGSTQNIDVQWNSALNIRDDLLRNRPLGYVLKSSENKSVETLQNLGVKISRTCGPLKLEKYVVVSVQEVKKADVTGSVGTIKNTVLKIKTELKTEEVFVEIEDYYVSLAQPLGNIILAALEPESQSSFPANYFLSKNITEGDELPVYRVLQNPVIQLAFKESACLSGSSDSAANTNRPVCLNNLFVTAIVLVVFCTPLLRSSRDQLVRL